MIRLPRWSLLACLVTAPALAAPSLGGCPLRPADNVWNTRVDNLPVATQSAQWIAAIGASGALHPDFGSDPSYGIPWLVVPANEPLRAVSFDYADESDPGPYPVPLDAPVEGGGDAHVLVVQQGSCLLYELYAAEVVGSGWQAGSGAVFDLRTNTLRPDGWTSADAAGLPILPGLVRRDEVLAGHIDHALRFTAPNTRNTHVWPARHDAGLANTSLPPMGIRVRLRADYPEAGFAPAALVIVHAMKTYGMILADNGSRWYFTGETNPAWDDDVLNQLKAIHGSDFEVVDESALQVAPDSGEARIFKGDFDPQP